jgi:hypothetical protein
MGILIITRSVSLNPPPPGKKGRGTKKPVSRRKIKAGGASRGGKNMSLKRKSLFSERERRI